MLHHFGIFLDWDRVVKQTKKKVSRKEDTTERMEGHVFSESH